MSMNEPRNLSGPDRVAVLFVIAVAAIACGLAIFGAYLVAR